MNEVKILDGNTFVVSDDRGDIEASPIDATGLFSFDTRFLSTWVLTVNGERLNALSVDDLQYFETRFFLVPGTGTVYIDAKLSVIRRRAVGGGFHEELTILNHSDKPVRLEVRLDAGCDFADLFEVKDALKKKGKYYARVTGGRLVLGYERKTFRRETSISASTPAKVDKNGLTFTVRLKPQASWQTELDVVPVLGSYARAGVMTAAKRRSKVTMEKDLGRWVANAPRVECDWEPLKATYRRSLVDMAALRFSPPVAGGANLPAAGLPWFMTMFGRDSIFTSLQALPFAPELAETTLRALGAWQGSGLDDFRDEDPGRILHEMRYGEMTAFEERPHSPYYGCADATPLYVVLLDEYERWTGDRKARAGSRARGEGGSQLDRRVRRPARDRLRLVPAPQREDRPREPVLEGLLGLDLLPRRPAARLSAGDVRAPGLRLRREAARRPPGAPRLEGRGLRGPAGAGGSRPQAALQPRLLGGRRRVLRPGSRHGGKAGGRPRLEQRPSALERHRGSVQGKGGRGAAAGPEALLRLGRPYAGRGRSALQPHRLPRRHGLAVRQLVHRVGLAPVRVQGGGGPQSPPASSTPPTSSPGACPRRSVATRASRRSTRCSTRRHAARRPGRPARPCSCCGRCWASSPRTSIS